MQTRFFIGILCWMCAVSLTAQGLLDEEPKGTTRALVVGIADYENDSIDLRFANRDAEIFALFLTTEMGGSVDTQHIVLLTDSLASEGAVKLGLRWLLKESEAGDRAIVYFSGHGDVERLTDFHDGYLLTYDTPPGNYEGNALSVDYLNKVLATLSNKKAEVILITDACRSGNLAGGALDGNALTNQALLQNINGITKILSCKSEELSQESPSWGGGRGVFSYYLIKGLSGEADRDQNKVVTLGELQLYLLINVPSAVKPESQTPKVDGPNDSQQLSDVQVVDSAVVEANETPPEGAFLVAFSSGFKSGALENPNPNVEELAKNFEQALRQGSLLTPANLSAMDYFRKLERKIAQAEADNFRIRLAAALQEEAQAAINRYLAADSLELARQTIIAETFIYDQYPKLLSAAADLVGKDDLLYPELMAKSYFLEAVNQRLKGLINQEAKKGAQKALDLLELAAKDLDAAAYVHLEMGLDHILLNQLHEAELHLKKATELAPTWPIPYAYLSSLYRQTGQPEQMLDFGARAVEADPQFFGGYIEKGKALESLGDLLMAEANYRQALLLNMDSYIPFEQLGFLYLKTGQFFLADEMLYESDLRKGLQIPEFALVTPDGTTDNDRDGVPDNYDNELDSYFREDLYLQLTQINPNDIDSYLILARYYFKNRRWSEAEYMFRQVIALDPAHLEANDNLFKLMKLKKHLAGMELFLDILDPLAPGKYLESRLELYRGWERYCSREPLLRKANQLRELNWHYTRELRFTNIRWMASESFAAKGTYSQLAEEIAQLRNTDIHEPDYTFYTGLLEMHKPAYLEVPKFAPLRNRSGMEYAQDAFSSVIATRYPATPQALFWMSQLDRQMTSYLEYHQSTYRKELEKQESYLENAGKALEASPGNLDFKLAYIDALVKNWKYEEALSVLESLEKDQLLDAEWAIKLARLRTLSGKQAAAQHLLDQIQYAFIRQEEAPDTWYRSQGLLAQLTDQHVEAGEAFQTIVSRTYNSADDYYQQCRSLTESGQLEQALAVLEVAKINGFGYDRVFKYDPHLRVLREWSQFEQWKQGKRIDWNAYRRATRYN